MENKLERLSKKIGYAFKNPLLLKQALTHRSASPKNNERFEFLGDSILSLVIANALFKQFPEESEGKLSRLRAHLVKGEMLAIIAQQLGLGDYLYLGQGELKSGGFRRESILADALEALFAAVYLDSNFESCQTVILNLYQSRLEEENLNHQLKDAKTLLQEYLQANKQPLPEYTLLKVEGEEQEQIFHVKCELTRLERSSEGQGSTRRKAEQMAAQALLKYFQK